MKNLSLVVLSVLAVSKVHATQLSDFQLHLPDYVNRWFGRVTVVESNGSNISLQYKESTMNIGPAGKSGSVVRKKFIFVRPDQISFQDKRKAIAKNLLAALSQEGKMKLATQDLPNMRLVDEKQKVYSINLWDKAQKVFADKVLGNSVAKDDALAEMWYRLKFEGEDPRKENKYPKKGTPLLVSIHQFGYYEKSDSMMTNLRRRLDFGHSAIGIRYFGEEPENDLILNPGSKSIAFDSVKKKPKFEEVTLPNSLDPNVPNLVDVDNLWVWVETQMRLRYMKVRFVGVPLTKTQLQAMDLILPNIKDKGLNFGPAIALTNNCADGAAALVNFLMPVEQTFPVETLGVALPRNVMNGTEDHFRWAFDYTFPDISKQNPGDQTPPASYKDQNFKRDELTFFDMYKKAEKSFFK